MAKIRNISGKPQPGASAKVNVDLTKASDLQCSNCECKVFEAAFMFKKLSALVSPTGQETLVPVQTFKCSECGNIEDMFLPETQ